MSSHAQPAYGQPTRSSFAAEEASRADEAATTEARGAGWVVFSGVMLLLAGAVNLVDGLWALDMSDSAAIRDEVEDLLWYSNSLETWGWIYTVTGGILLAAGIGVFSRSQLARWTGVALAAGSAVVNMMWVFVYPIPALIHVALASFVIYGLTAYGAKEA
jgi:hypothetical protein